MITDTSGTVYGQQRTAKSDQLFPVYQQPQRIKYNKECAPFMAYHRRTDGSITCKCEWNQDDHHAQADDDVLTDDGVGLPA